MERKIDKVKEILLDVIGTGPKDTLLDQQVQDLPQFIEEYLDMLQEEAMKIGIVPDKTIQDAYDFVRADLKNMSVIKELVSRK